MNTTPKRFPNISPSYNGKMTVRKVRYQCKDEIGQISTFTVNENGKQNSPSFASFYDLSTWSLQPQNYSFRAELKLSNNFS